MHVKALFALNECLVVSAGNQAWYHVVQRTRVEAANLHVGAYNQNGGAWTNNLTWRSLILFNDNKASAPVLTPILPSRRRCLSRITLECWLLTPSAYQGKSSPNMTDGDAPTCSGDQEVRTTGRISSR